MAIIDNNPFSQSNPTPTSARNSPSLSTQLSNLNNEMTLIENSLIEGFVRESATVAYLTTKTFSVVGNVTAFYTPGRVVRFNADTTPTFATVVSSVFTTLTTVTVYEATVPNPLDSVGLDIRAKTDTEPVQIAPTIINPTVAGSTQKVTSDGDGVTITLDFDGATGSSIHEVLVGDGSTPNPLNRTIAFANMAIGKFVQVDIIQDAVGGRTVTWPTAKWDNAIVPTLSTSAGARDSFAFKKNADGTINGYTIGQNMS